MEGLQLLIVWCILPLAAWEMKMKRYLLIGLVFLAGCQTKTVEEMNYTERKALAAELTKRCYAQGVKPNSPEFEACARVEVQREAYTRRDNKARFERGMAGIGQGLQNASQGYYRAAAQSQANRTVTCTNVAAPAGYAKVRCY